MQPGKQQASAARRRATWQVGRFGCRGGRWVRWATLLLIPVAYLLTLRIYLRLHPGDATSHVSGAGHHMSLLHLRLNPRGMRALIRGQAADVGRGNGTAEGAGGSGGKAALDALMAEGGAAVKGKAGGAMGAQSAMAQLMAGEGGGNGTGAGGVGGGSGGEELRMWRREWLKEGRARRRRGDAARRRGEGGQQWRGWGGYGPENKVRGGGEGREMSKEGKKVRGRVELPPLAVPSRPHSPPRVAISPCASGHLSGGRGTRVPSHGPHAAAPPAARLPLRARLPALPPSRVAICLVGGAREFHLTASTLQRHLLPAYPSAHVFLLAPLDHSAHRLSLLAWPHLGAARLGELGGSAGGRVGAGEGVGGGGGRGDGDFPGYSLVQVSVLPDVPVNETKITDRLLEVVEGSEAQTRQGLMQQFKAVELCVTAITRYERAHAIRYDWILRTRVDGYWMGPPPPLAVLDPIAYTIPGGSDWGGLNDRLGMGGRKASWKALRRLSVLRPLVERGGYSELNAERVYLAQMAFLQVQVARYDFPFCILSRKKGLPAFPVAAALSSTSAALNGAKCRPCRPSVVGGQAAKYILALPERIFGAQPHGIDLCRAEDDWAADWREIFDKDAGEVPAAARQYMETRTFDECVEDWRYFHQQVPVWNAPPPVSICVRGLLGKFHKMGYPGGDFPVFLDPWVGARGEARGRKPVVYSAVAGVDYSFDWALMRKLRCRVHAFESTPEGMRWIGDKIDNLPPASWVHHAWLLAPHDRPLQVYPLDIEEHPVEYAVAVPPGMDGSSLPPPIQVEAMTVEGTMKLLNHSIVDIMRIGGHVSLHEAIFRAWVQAKRAPPVCQVARYDFPFCILSRKKGLPAFPVAAALSSTSAALNGAKCRPCRPSVVGGQAAKYILALPERIFGAQPHGIDLCRAEDDWAADWREIFDKDAGEVPAAARQYMETRTFDECVEDWRYFHQQVPVWNAPPPVSICVRGLLGKFHKLGYPGGDFPVFLDPWVGARGEARGRKPVVYSAVAGVDYSFDWALMRKLRCRVHAFESTPEGMRWIGDKIDNLPPASWVHHAWLLAPHDRPLQVYPLDIEEHPVEYAVAVPPGMDGSSLPPPIQVEAMTVEGTMKLLNHSIVDIMRIGGHVSLHEAIFRAWVQAKRAPPVCQVARYDFPFCILSRKKGLPAFPVAAALSSTSAALNGAKCRPCRPSVVGGQAAKYILALPERNFGAQPHGIDLCRAEDDWAADWREIFDKDAGEVPAAARQYMETRTFDECVEDWRYFHQQVHVWNAPPPVSICVRGLLGKFHKMGYPGGDFPVFLDPWVGARGEARGRKPVVYSAVAGVDYSFDWALMRKLRCRVHAFESTPEGMRWIGDKIDNLPPASWVHHAWLLAPHDRPLQVYLPDIEEHPVEYAVTHIEEHPVEYSVAPPPRIDTLLVKGTPPLHPLHPQVYPLDIEEHPVEYAVAPPPGMDGSSLPPPIQVEAMTVEGTMKLLNHSIVDIMRIGGHVSLHEAIFRAWVQAKRAPRVCEVSVGRRRLRGGRG
ncbi:unnamed protein product [Closterium sp. Naga37s-1]|nr:unnamed protein product [Closterium sp. Naga37s-1]